MAVLVLLVHGALHVVDHGEAADGLQEVVVRPVGTAGPGGATCSMVYPPYTLGAPKTMGLRGFKVKGSATYSTQETEALDLLRLHSQDLAPGSGCQASWVLGLKGAVVLGLLVVLLLGRKTGRGSCQGLQGKGGMAAKDSRGLARHAPPLPHTQKARHREDCALPHLLSSSSTMGLSSRRDR